MREHIRHLQALHSQDCIQLARELLSVRGVECEANGYLSADGSVLHVAIRLE